MKVDPDKIAVIKDWKTHESEQELKTGYNRKFIEGFSQIASPLHATLSKQENKNTGKKILQNKFPFRRNGIQNVQLLSKILRHVL